MSIIVTNKGHQFIVNELVRSLAVFEISKIEIETEIVKPLIDSIQAESRWVVLTYEEMKDLADRYRKTLPPEHQPRNFRTNYGKIWVECRQGVYLREYVANNTVIKGWHREVTEGIKSRNNIPFNKDIGEIIFNVGQVIISNEDNQYLEYQ